MKYKDTGLRQKPAR